MLEEVVFSTTTLHLPKNCSPMSAKMSNTFQTSSDTPNVPRAKRTKTACNHCRWKRWKCSRDPHAEKCMTCIAYHTKCEYSAPWGIQNNATGKRKRSPVDDLDSERKSRPSEQTSTKLQYQPTHFQQSPVAKPTKKEFSPQFRAENLTPKSSTREIPISPSELGRDGVYAQDDLSQQLSQYLSPMMMGVTDLYEGVDRASEPNVGLPPRSIVETQVTSFFDNVAPLYPILDEATLRRQIDEYYQGKMPDDYRGWFVLVRLVMCTGMAAATHSMPATYEDPPSEWTVLGNILAGHGADLPHQILAFGKLISAQILLLVTLYCFQTKRLNTAWACIRWTIRLTHASALSQNEDGSMDEDIRDLKDRITWSIFILENHLSVIQLRDDPRLHESVIKEPSEKMQKDYPIFCHRISLARVGNKFVRASANPPNASDYANRFEDFYTDVVAWQNSVTVGYRPDSEILAEEEVLNAVLVLHVEYHTLLCQMVNCLCAASVLLENLDVYQSHPSLRIRNRVALRANHSRKLLQMLNTLADRGNVKPNGNCWINSIPILSAFNCIYSHVIKTPSLLSARSDIELLLNAIQLYGMHSSGTRQDENIIELTKQMYRSAADIVSKANGMSDLAQTSSPTILGRKLTGLNSPSVDMVGQAPELWPDFFGEDFGGVIGHMERGALPGGANNGLGLTSTGPFEWSSWN